MLQRVIITAASLLVPGFANAAPINYQLDLEAAIGYSNNIYRAGSQRYVDYSMSTMPTITPVQHSGFFIPLTLNFNADGYFKQYKLTASLDSYADYHLGGQINNRDKTVNHLKMGAQQSLKRVDRKQDSLYLGLLHNIKQQSYFERDTGSDRLRSSSDLSEQYSYTNTGYQLHYQSSTTTPSFKLEAELGKRRYQDAQLTEDLNYQYDQLKASGGHQFNNHSRLNAAYQYRSQRFLKHHARGLDAASLASHPLLKYQFHTLDLALEQRLVNHFSSTVQLIHTTRSDDFQGYNDYVQRQVMVGLKLQQGSLRHHLSADFAHRSYSRAFAFDNPSQSRKTYQSNSLRWFSEVQRSKKKSLWGKVEYRSVTTNDLRYNYNALTLIAGIKYRY